jgi:hypothetical protein
MMTGYCDWATFGTVEATALRPGDHDELVEIASVHCDPADIPILRHWIDRQPEAFTIVRSGSGEILGFVGILLLAEASSDDLAIDPVVAAAWHHASRNDPPRPGQVIGVNRFSDDRVHGQSTSPTFNVVSWKCTQVWLTTPGLSWFYITVRDEQFWTPMMSYLDFHRVRDVDADVGGMRLSAYCRDWRRLGPAAWLDLMEERELGGPIVAPPAPPVLVVLSEDDFAAAVRKALGDLARPDRLVTNPLMASRVVIDQSAHATPAGIAEVLRLGLASLPDDPRTDKARRALERTSTAPCHKRPRPRCSAWPSPPTGATFALAPTCSSARSGNGSSTAAHRDLGPGERWRPLVVQRGDRLPTRLDPYEL